MPGVGESGEGEFFEEAERLDGPGWMEQRVGPLAPSSPLLRVRPYVFCCIIARTTEEFVSASAS